MKTIAERNETISINSLTQLKSMTSTENNKLIESYIKDGQASNNTKLGSYKNQLIAFKKLIEANPGKLFKSMDADVIKDFVVGMQNKKGVNGGKFYSPTTLWDYNRALKSFFNWMKKGDCVSWIKRANNVGVRVPEAIISEADLYSLTQACKNIQQQAMVSVLFDSACRLSEFLGMNYEALYFDELGARIKVDGKTGERQVRLIACMPYLRAWLEQHPLKQGALWLNSKNERMCPTYLGRFLEGLGRKAKLKYRIYPHLFRKSRLTQLASSVPEQVLKNFAGWSKASRMPMHYVFMDGKQVDNALFKAAGMPIKDIAESKGLTCKACFQANLIGSTFCVKCGRPLNDLKALRQEQDLAFANEVMNKFILEVMRDKVMKEKLEGLMSQVKQEKSD